MGRRKHKGVAAGAEQAAAAAATRGGGGAGGGRRGGGGGGGGDTAFSIALNQITNRCSVPLAAQAAVVESALALVGCWRLISKERTTGISFAIQIKHP